jgi:TPR repeat protein
MAQQTEELVPQILSLYETAANHVIISNQIAAIVPRPQRVLTLKMIYGRGVKADDQKASEWYAQLHTEIGIVLGHSTSTGEFSSALLASR